MSLSKVSIDFNGIFENGQAYTALSRVKTLAGAHLIGLTLARMRMVSTVARGWYQQRLGMQQPA